MMASEPMKGKRKEKIANGHTEQRQLAISEVSTSEAEEDDIDNDGVKTNGPAL